LVNLNRFSGKPRTFELETSTKETRIRVRVNIDGTGSNNISTGTKFLDHMLASFATHSLIDINLQAKGDLRHHIIEDSALALGKCLDNALGDRKGLVRFGFASIPMDEALSSMSLDLVKRSYFVCSDLQIKRNSIEDLPKEDVEHFLRSLCNSLQCTAHLRVEYGTNDHHKIEACFKALAVAFRKAAERDSRRNDLSIPSSKGSMG